MTADEAIAKLDDLAATSSGDPETAHWLADEVLLELAGADVAAAYRRIITACRWWAHA